MDVEFWSHVQLYAHSTYLCTSTGGNRLKYFLNVLQILLELVENQKLSMDHFVEMINKSYVTQGYIK